MVSESDFVTIPFNHDMTLAGIKFTCQSFTSKRENLGKPYTKMLWGMIAKNVVKLGFKRYLDKTTVPYEMLRPTPFTDPDYYDIFIGGRRCDIHVIMITDKRQIRLIQAEPHLLLKAEALNPIDLLSGDEFFDEDILIFTVVTALVTPNRDTIEKANAAGQPLYMFNMLPSNWVNPVKWNSLGTILVESNQENTIQLEFGGINIHRQFQFESLSLKPYTQMDLKQNFYTLSYVYTPNLPDDTIRVNSSFLKETYLVEPYSWNNLWIYGMDIIIGGFVTRMEYQKNARYISKINRNINSVCDSKEIFTLPIQSLNPINDLFKLAKSWSQL
jgi:hypothetical protein